MERINILDIKTTNKIAAGEVIERPSSVVKELVENSIDAGAKNITIEIIEGGKELIRVIDDGLGIHEDDIEKAFLPHSTSKIKEIDDIYKISTMGFRGEALASIASVSKTKLKSRTIESKCGHEIYIIGGKIDCIKDAASNQGTTIEVRDLFFNVPARKKFLKSTNSETAHISDIISRLALANASVSFKFLNNGKKSITTFGTGKLQDVIRSIYGKNIYENIISIEKHSDTVSAYGYIGNSEISRGSRNNQSIFVNKRYIKDKSITSAVERAFKSFLMINKFPFFIIFIDIFPEFVDINVHPSKLEVKFSESGFIFKFIFDAVHEAIRESMKESFTLDIPDAYEKLPKYNLHETEKEKIQIPIDLEKHEHVNYKIDIPYEKPESIFSVLKEDKSVQKKPIVPETQNSSPKFPELRIIGQFNNTYIICEALNTLYIIDQHAAHEKILFEKYRNDIKNGTVASQMLLAPEVIELSSYDYSTYLENSGIFKNAGFCIDSFGDNAISIRQVPVILGKPDVKNFFEAILDDIKNMGSGETYSVKYNLIATKACKAAIKAHDSLSRLEMENLVEDLRYIDDPFNCPHGRPTIIKFTVTDLEKKFKRIQ